MSLSIFFFFLIYWKSLNFKSRVRDKIKESGGGKEVQKNRLSGPKNPAKALRPSSLYLTYNLYGHSYFGNTAQYALSPYDALLCICSKFLHHLQSWDLEIIPQLLNPTLSSPPSKNVLPAIYQLTMLVAGHRRINEIKSLLSRNSLWDIFGRKEVIPSSGP